MLISNALQILNANLKEEKMRKSRLIVSFVMLLVMMLGHTVSAYANNMNSASTDTNSINLSKPTYKVIEDIDIVSDNSLDDSNRHYLPVIERSRSAAALADNPNTQVTGTLTTDNPQDLYFFSITDSNRFLLARLTSTNSNYVALLYMYDNNAEEYVQTSIYGFAGTLIQLNGLPVGDYVFAIFSYDGTYGDSYTFDINATNPAANLSSVKYIATDLSIFIFETTDGDIYGNGKFIYNTSATINSNLTWQRVSENNWGSGYEQRTHNVYNVHVASMSGPVSYSSSYASSNCAVLLYCDIGTGFSYFHSYYQSGNPPVHEMSWEDTTGRTTPRALDQADFTGGNQHILIYDIVTGQCIDFYSTLNVYYAAGYESAPVITFY